MVCMSFWKSLRFFFSGFVFLLVNQATVSLADQLTQLTDSRRDFYSWANKEWLENTVIPNDQPRVDNFTYLENKVYDQLRELLGELRVLEHRTEEQEKLIQLYDGFANIDQRNKRGIQSIEAELESISLINSHREVAKKFAQFAQTGITTPLEITAETDYKNAPNQIAFISQAGLGIEREYYLGTDAESLKQRTLYKGMLQKLFVLAAYDQADSRADEVLALETALAKIQWSTTENRDMQKTYNPISVSLFLKNTSALYADDIITLLNMPRTGRVNIMQPSYVDKYGELFQKTGLVSWRNYLRARLLQKFAPLLTADFTAVMVTYQKDLGLISEEKPLWKQGIDYLSSTVNFMVGRAYVEKYFNEETKSEVASLVKSIQTQYKEAISRSQWLSKPTKQKANDKLNKMRFKIGYPDKWRDYSGLTFIVQDPVENYIRAARFEHKRVMSKIGQPLDRSDWGYSPHEINAFYDPTRNEFVLLAAILQDPFFSPENSKAIHYGGIGFIVGHEIGHGFDDQGSLFDGNGNLTNWWSSADQEAYNIKKNRLIAQANAYEILPNTFLKGAQEIGEIMGDLSGAQIALNALLAGTPHEKSRQDQIKKEFFIQLARTWRSRWREEFLLFVLQSNAHPPSEFRANGIVKQFSDFYALFDVHPGDKMYLTPEDRVLLW